MSVRKSGRASVDSPRDAVLARIERTAMTQAETELKRLREEQRSLDAEIRRLMDALETAKARDNDFAALQAEKRRLTTALAEAGQLRFALTGASEAQVRAREEAERHAALAERARAVAEERARHAEASRDEALEIARLAQAKAESERRRWEAEREALGRRTHDLAENLVASEADRARAQAAGDALRVQVEALRAERDNHASRAGEAIEQAAELRGRLAALTLELQGERDRADRLATALANLKSAAALTGDALAKTKALADRRAQELAGKALRIEELDARLSHEMACALEASESASREVAQLSRMVVNRDAWIVQVRRDADSELATIASRVDELSAERDRTVAARDQALAAREAILSSASWRLAAPARWMVRTLRRIRARLRQGGGGDVSTDAVLVRESGLFEPEWYLATYPDVAAAGMDPVLHFLEHGAREGRDPGRGFSTRGYLEKYPDVLAAELNPLVHFLRHGHQEGRTP